MSLPGLAPQALATAMSISPVDSFLHVFNTNQYFIGIMMLILNLGGRFISLEVTKKQEQFLQHPWVRRLLIFTVFFVATRNIWVAFWLTITVILFLGYIFNENSSLCIFGSGGSVGSKCDSSINKQSEDLTPEEKEILQRLSAKQQRYQQQIPTTKKTQQGDNNENDDQDDVEITDIYAANVSLLKS